MPMEPERTDVSRRRVLNAFIAVTGLGWLGSMLYPVLRYLQPLPRAGASGPVPVPAEALAKLDGPLRFAILRAAGTRIIVLKDRDDTLHALSAVCTHEGCTIQYVPGEANLWCACHNARYGLDGAVISGPPPRPLRRYAIERSADGALNVKVEG